MSRSVPIRYGRVSPLVINWQRGVSETFEFKTEMFEARDGREKRAALRENPRYLMEIDCHAHRDEIRRFLGDMSEGQQLAFYVPVPWRRVFLAATASAPGAALSVSEVPYWLVPGCRLVVSGAGQVEAVDVLSIVGTTVALTRALRGAYPSGSTAYLAVSARAPDDVDFQAETSTIWRGRVNWEQNPGADPWPVYPATPTLREGHEVFLHRPNWRDTPRISIKQMREIVDSGRGTIAVSAPSRDSMLEFRLQYSGFNTARGDELLAFFFRMKGKRGAFWMPTWQQDLDAVSTGPAELTIPGTDAFFAYSASRTFTTVAVRHANGEYQINRVETWSTSGGNTVAAMEDAWDFPVTADTLVMWCPLWRFATDRLEVERQSGTITDMTFSVMSLIQGAS